MSDNLPMSLEDSDALPVNERSSAFIDSVAFLNFIRMKSLASLREVGKFKSAARPSVGGKNLKASSMEKDKSISYPKPNSAIEVEIEPEDWDSLFGAVEERLRGTVEALDSSTAPVILPDKLSRIKAVVLDCVSSLDALHTALRHDRGLRLASGPKRDASDVRSASPPTSSNSPSPKN